MRIKLDAITSTIKVMQTHNPWQQFFVHEIGDWHYAREYFYD